MWMRTSTLLVWLAVSLTARAADVGNRLAYLDEFCDPYYAGLDVPKLVTPQWVGEEGVDAVIVLAVDDMTDTKRYEEFLRPILNRLKQIDGRAGVSIMTKQVDPRDPQLQTWFEQSLNVEAHTYDHPCPCLQGGSLARAKNTYDRCVDLLAEIPGGRPVAFRMPCCDSMNSVSPRFFTEVFNKTTAAGRFLTIDSSVFHIFSANDPELPRALVFDEDGREKFRKYVPTDRVMVNSVEDYPYPYVIGRLCWEIACLMPSDWDAQHLNGKCSPDTVRDLKAAVDAVVIKRGIFSLCFHPHGWIAADQIVDLIDYAVTKHGRKIKFLNFREVQERLDENLLGGHPLRAPDGGDNGVRILDVNNDGYMDVIIGNEKARQTRVWSPGGHQWTTADLPRAIVDAGANETRRDAGVRFGVLMDSGNASMLVCEAGVRSGVWHFDGRRWISDPNGLKGLDARGPICTSIGGRDRGVRLRDLDIDGICELIVGNEKEQGVFRWAEHGWQRCPFSLPDGTAIVDAQGRDAGLRFVDFDEEGYADVVFSNAKAYSAHLFTSMAEGWSRQMLSGKRPSRGALPMIVRGDGTNNGAWFNYRHMWVQNEDTGGKLDEHVESRHFTDDFLAAEKDPRRGRRKARSAPSSPAP